MKKLLLGAAVAVTATFALTGCSQEPFETEYYTFGQTAEFDGKEITLGTEVEWLEVNGEEAFKLPMTITNLNPDEETVVEFYWTLFSETEEVHESLNIYVPGSLSAFNYIPAGETVETFIVFAYHGDGEYHLQFSDATEELIDIKVEVTKP